MSKATQAKGILNPISGCYIDIDDLGVTIPMYILPDISDSKSVSYPDENGIGRSMPFKSFQNSENRTISWTAHFIITNNNASGGGVSADDLVTWLRAIEACADPQDQNTNGAPYAPPPICKLQCGRLLSEEKEICAVLKNYSVKFDTTVPWDQQSFMPYKLDIDMQFDVVYNQSDLPGASQIMESGY